MVKNKNILELGNLIKKVLSLDLVCVCRYDCIKNTILSKIPGSGTGLAGIAAAALGASNAYLTDLAYTIPNIIENVKKSFPDYLQRPEKECREGECNDSASVISPDQVCSIDVGVLDWSDPMTYKGPILTSTSGSDKWDVIIGADIVWIESLVPSLVSTLAALACKDSLVILSHQVTTLNAIVSTLKNHLYTDLLLWYFPSIGSVKIDASGQITYELSLATL
jgi:Lysine methyltransferase